MAFAKKEGAYEIIKEGNEEVMRIEYGDKSFPPFLEDSKLCMADTIDKIIEAPQITRVIFTLTKNYQYDAEQVSMLREVANLYVHLVKQKKVLSFGTFDVDYSAKYGMIQYIILNLFKGDPLGAYVEVKRLIREQKIKMKDLDEQAFRREKEFLDLLIYIYDVLDKTKLIGLTKSELDGYTIGDRTLYRKVFRAIITPNFLFTRLMAEPPLDDEEVDTYSVDGIDVMIFKMSGDVRYKYHVVPPEFKIDEENHILIDIARNVLAEHKPEAEEFIDPDKMRYNFFNIGRDLLSDVAEHKGIELSYEEAEELARILVRYTVGFGLIEVLLQDPKIQDITVNGPIGETPIFVVHEDYGDCVTNIIPSREDGEGWATRFRLISGRPLDEANPVLDTGLTIPGARARVAIITNPLNPFGLGYSFRRHRDKPWTLPLFINNGMMNSLTAGMISFLVDGARTMLIAGSRSSGKTSLLGSVMVELMRRYRVITLEDSVTGDSSIFVKRAGRIEKTTIGKLIDSLIERYGCWYNLSEHEILGNDDDLDVFSMNKEGKLEFKRVSKFIRHKVSKPVYKILTRTGREIKVTGDHSLFTLGDEAEIKEIKTSSLNGGDYIATPRNLRFNNKGKRYLNLLDYLDRLDKGYFEGEVVRELFNKYYYEIRQLGKEHRHDRSLNFKWRRKGFIPVKIVKDLSSLGYDISCLKSAYFKNGQVGSKFPVLIELDEDLLTFVGLWLAD